MNERQRMLAKVILAAGALTTVGGMADLGAKVLGEEGRKEEAALKTVRNFERNTVRLAREGRLDQIPQSFDSQEVKAAYQELERQSKDALIDGGISVGGIILTTAGIVVFSRSKKS